MDQKLLAVLNIPEEELGKRSPIALEVVQDDEMMCQAMAEEILALVRENNAAGRHTVFIWPVGPVGQYAPLARRINAERIDFKNVYVFQMDEYLDDDLDPIPEDHPLSFTGFLKRFFQSIDPELRPAPEQHHIPTRGREAENWTEIQRLGGVDMAVGGIGINGHIAFNEPPEPGESISDAAFKALGTRVLRISRETRTINGFTGARGAIDLIPQYCITIGMKEILSAKKIRFYCNREWQCGIVRKILHGEVSCHVPASFFQQHPDAKLTVTRQVARVPMGALR